MSSEKLRELMKEKVPALSLSLPFQQQLDSVQFIVLLAEIEREFGIKFSFDEINSDAMSTPTALIQLVAEKLKA